MENVGLGAVLAFNSFFFEISPKRWSGMPDSTGDQHEGGDSLVKQLSPEGGVDWKCRAQNDDQILFFWERFRRGEEPGEQVNVVDGLVVQEHWRLVNPARRRGGHFTDAKASCLELC